MFRFVLFIIAVLFLGVVFAFLADYPAEIVLSLPNWRLSFTPVAALAIVIAAIIALWLIQLIFKMLVAPFSWRASLRKHKKAQAYKALSSGLVAAFLCDKEKAEAEAELAKEYLPENEEPLTALLLAQIEDLRTRQENAFSGSQNAKAADTAEAEKPNRLIIANKNKKTTRDIKLIELKTAYQAAIARDDLAQAHYAAIEVAEKQPGLIWANLATISAHAEKGEWNKALEAYERFAKAWQKAAKKDKSLRIQQMLTYYKQVLLCGQVRDLFPYQPHQARQIILHAHKLNRDFVPATVLATQILFQLDEFRKAEKILTTQWEKAPHPDLGQVYIKAGGRIDEPEKELERALNLSSSDAGNRTGQVLCAFAAFNAEDYALAQEYAEKAQSQKATQEGFILLAKIARLTQQDAKTEAYLTQALTTQGDTAWYADDIKLENWQAVSPKSHVIGACIWQAPQYAQTIIPQEIEELLKERPKTTHYPQGSNKVSALKDKAQQQDYIAHARGVEDAARGVSEQNLADDDKSDTTYLNVDNPGISSQDK